MFCEVLSIEKVVHSAVHCCGSSLLCCDVLRTHPALFCSAVV